MKKIMFVVIGVAAFILVVVSLLFLSRIKGGASHEKIPAAEGALIKDAQALEASGNLLKAKVVYEKMISDNPQSNSVLDVQKKLWDLNIKLLFSPVATPDSTIYEVQPHDNIWKIAKKMNTTDELIKKANNLSSDIIRPGMKLKISTGKFSILVNKSQNTLMLKSGDDVIKIYQVSTGLNNCTPVGTFKIVNKIVNPPWYKAGAIVPPGSPKNILGSRWMGLNNPGYGIHGTTIPESIGKQATAGCVRMNSAEVEELYSIVPVGTEVTIID